MNKQHMQNKRTLQSAEEDSKTLKRVLSSFFGAEKILLWSVLTVDNCTITYRDLLSRTLPQAKTVILYAVPYFSGSHPERNLSLYALAKDYHLYLSDLNHRLITLLKECAPQEKFFGFGDHSPIAESEAAAKAGLGVLGDNHLLITRDYGSFVFLGEVFTTLEADVLSCTPIRKPGECLHCGACKKACPCHFENCASGIGQKKGQLTPEEEQLVLQTGLLWGCDICQVACPLNKHIQITPISFFKEDIIPRLDKTTLDGMAKEEFKTRAFAWRGRQPISRNIELFEKATSPFPTEKEECK